MNLNRGGKGLNGWKVRKVTKKMVGGKGNGSEGGKGDGSEGGKRDG